MRLLVVFHIYYEPLADYYLSRMGNIHSCEWDLLCSGHNLSEEVKAKVRAVKPDARFVEVPNVGYDVWPFIFCVKNVDMSAYDVIVKLHTKNNDGRIYRFHGRKMDGDGWRDYLVNPIIGSRENFTRMMESFRRNPNQGLAYSQMLNFSSGGVNPEDGAMLTLELQRLGIERKSSLFCAGTMFASTPQALSFLKDDAVNESIFEESGSSHSCATMAHVYERLIPIAIQSKGYGLKLIPVDTLSRIRFAFSAFMSWIFSVNYYSDNNRKCLKLFGFIIKL